MTRPTDYDKEYHPKKLLELMSGGATNIEVCAEFGISENTFYRWRKTHEEFNESFEQGLPKAEVESIIKPLKEMISTGNDKGYKALAHLARNKYGHDKQVGSGVVNNTQINVGSITINNKEEYEKLTSEIKDQLVDLNIIDVDFLEIKKDE